MAASRPRSFVLLVTLACAIAPALSAQQPDQATVQIAGGSGLRDPQ